MQPAPLFSCGFVQRPASVVSQFCVIPNDRIFSLLAYQFIMVNYRERFCVCLLLRGDVKAGYPCYFPLLGCSRTIPGGAHCLLWQSLCTLTYVRIDIMGTQRKGICINIQFAWLVSYFKVKVWKLTNPAMSYCIKLSRAHYVSQGIVIGEDREVRGIKQVVPKFITNCPL